MKLLIAIAVVIIVGGVVALLERYLHKTADTPTDTTGGGVGGGSIDNEHKKKM